MISLFAAMALVGSPAAISQETDAVPEADVAEADVAEADVAEADVAEADVATEGLPTPLDAEGNLIRFDRDIAPILRARCLECHGPEEAKADFRVDDPDLFLEFIEAGDHATSLLYTDYLTTDDEDLLMPPRENKGPLSAGELALIRVWIDEGATWPEGAQVSDAVVPPPTAVANQPLTIGQRLWKSIGYLHPATIHFPIALFLLGGLFVVVGWRWPALGTQIPLACLLIGTVTAIASSAMGWSLAPTQGYGAGWELLNFERDIDAHRWSGLIVTIFATGASLIALIAVWKDSDRWHMVWKAGLLVCALTIGLVGHQGGELTYGRDFYPEMFRTLFGEVEQAAAAAETAIEPNADEEADPDA
jgi:uncharacterized membrane protein